MVLWFAGHRLPTERDPAGASRLPLRLERDAAPAGIHGTLSWVAWYPRDERLVAVRDRLGLTPLYFAEEGERVALSPFPVVLLRLLSRSLLPDSGAVLAHLHGHGPPSGNSYLAGVSEVEPGTCRVWERSGRRTERYWCPGEAGRGRRLAGGEAASHLGGLLDEIAADHATRTPAAVSVSGGLDSTTVAASLAGRSGGPLLLLHRHAAGFPEADESEGAQAVAHHLELPLARVPIADLGPLSRPDGLCTGVDSPVFPPFADPWEATWRRARELGVGVVYTGAGGDHLFGGTHQLPYLDLLLTGRWRHLVRDLRLHRQRVVGPWRRFLVTALVRPALRAAFSRWRPDDRIRVPWLAGGRVGEWRHVHRTVAFPPWEPAASLLPGHRDRLRFLTHRGSIELLHVLGRQAERHGIELRHPLLDSRLLDFVMQVPSWEVVQGGQPKAILRRAMAGRLPESVLSARVKTYPFSLFRKGMTETGAHHVRRLLTNMRAAEAGYVDEGELRAAYDRYCQGGGGGGLIWNALTLEDWLRRHF